MSTIADAAPRRSQVLMDSRTPAAHNCGGETRGAASDAQATNMVWTEVTPGLWVAQAGGNFAGMVERLWGAGFRVSDSVGRVVGEFSSLERAQGLLEPHLS